MKTQFFSKSSGHMQKIAMMIAAVALLFAMLSCNVSLSDTAATTARSRRRSPSAPSRPSWRCKAVT